MRSLILGAVAGLAVVGAAVAQTAADPFQWLEDITGAKSVAWVQGENAKTRGVLEGDARYETFRKEALGIFTAQDRIATPTFRGGAIDNFWQDATHKRGVWRRTSVDGYRATDPKWETILDIDALAASEHADWYFKGANCLEPEERYCLVRLSDGGKDAVTEREFDVQARTWVQGGFNLPESKQSVTWINKDNLLVARDWGAGSLTESGYPYIIKLLKRGQSLANADEMYRGTSKDTQIDPRVLRDADGVVRGIFYERGVSFFQRVYHLSAILEPGNQPLIDETWDGAMCEARCAAERHRRLDPPLPFPAKSSIQGLVSGQLVFKTEENWKGFQAGDLLSYDLKALIKDPASAEAHLIARAKANQSIEQVTLTHDYLVVTGLEDVKGFADVYDVRDGKWTAHRLDLPKNQDIQIVDASRATNKFFLETQGFLDPTALWLADASNGKVEKLKSLPPRFDASRDVVEQYWATSSDGVKIPYFVVRPKNMKSDGSTPTIMYGYGGFQLSKPPAYLPEVGKIWLERGGAYVIANIRGGGEFGPKWHEAVMREKRQLAFDDFAAVGRDLFKRGITSPRRLGIYGRSNGGVLMSVSMTQHPELWHAVVIESPLVDMMRYNHLSAGASWVGEYGNPDDPADAAFISKYSAYQNLKPGVAYPKPYITTNAKDDRVHPSHARKFAAKLGAMGYPYLFFEDNFGGHSYDADPTANSARWARHYTYLAQQLMD